MAALETCDNCGKTIGKLETPQIWNGSIVCQDCERTLRRKSQEKYAASKPRKSRVGKFIALAVVGLVVCFGGCFIWSLVGPSKIHFVTAHGTRLDSPITPISSGNVVVEYDKFKDETTVRLGDLFPAEKGQPDPWGLLYAKNGDGQYLQVPSDYTMHFQLETFFKGKSTDTLSGAVMMTCGYGGDLNGTVDFLIDGTTRFQLSDLAGKPTDQMLGWLPIDRARLLSTAKSVELAVGSAQFKMKPSQQAAIGEFLKSIGDK